MKRGWPTINLHALSPEEIWHIARTSELSLDATIDRLVAAGLDSIPGGGAEILDDEVRRRIAPLKCSTDEWLTVMRAAHLKGLKSTATLMFGVGEEPRAPGRPPLAAARRCRTRPAASPPSSAGRSSRRTPGSCPGDGSAHAYLRTNALARLFLDNVPNLQASWVTMGGGVAQAALHMGCNDFGQVMIEENVVSAAGTTFQMDSEEVERHIRDAGFAPARRNMRYERLAARRRQPRAAGAGRDRARAERRRSSPRRGVLTGRAPAARVADGAVALDGDRDRGGRTARRGRGALRPGRAARRRDPARARERPPAPRALAHGGAGRRRRGAARVDRALRLGPRPRPRGGLRARR